MVAMAALTSTYIFTYKRYGQTMKIWVFKLNFIHKIHLNKNSALRQVKVKPNILISMLFLIPCGLVDIYPLYEQLVDCLGTHAKEIPSCRSSSAEFWQSIIVESASSSTRLDGGRSPTLSKFSIVKSHGFLSIVVYKKWILSDDLDQIQNTNKTDNQNA